MRTTYLGLLVLLLAIGCSDKNDDPAGSEPAAAGA